MANQILSFKSSAHLQLTSQHMSAPLLPPLLTISLLIILIKWCGNLISDISDHFSQFCLLKSKKDKIRLKKPKMRDFSRFSSDRLHADLSNVNWNALFSNESSDVNNIFSSFYNKFNKLVNKHAPMKTISNRKPKQFSKPWITKGLRKSIRVKNKLYASDDRAKYKMYRNRICSLTRISKQQYYTKFFKDNLTNMKKTWEGINSILARKSKNSKTQQFGTKCLLH